MVKLKNLCKCCMSEMMTRTYLKQDHPHILNFVSKLKANTKKFVFKIDVFKLHYINEHNYNRLQKIII